MSARQARPRNSRQPQGKQYSPLRVCGAKWRAAITGERIGSGCEGRRELAGGEGVEGAEASAEFNGSQAALAIELAEKILRRLFPFLRVAFHTARNQVATGSTPPAGERHDVVKAPNEGRCPPQTIKAQAALARMDGLALCLILEKIRPLLMRGGARLRSLAANCANLLGQTHLDQVTGSAAFHQAQSTFGNESADSISRRAVGDASTPGEPGNGKPEAEAAF